MRFKHEPHGVFNVLLTRFMHWALAIVMVASMYPSISEAQVSAKEEAIAHIIALKKGVLIFVIPDFNGKIKALEEMLSAEANTTKKAGRIQQLLDQSVAERDSFGTALREAVREEYTFSSYDILASDSLPYVNSLKSIELLHRSIPKGGLYYAQRGTTESGADAMIILDSAKQVLSRPFPYYVRLVKFSAIFDAFFGIPEYSWRDLKKVVRKLNANLDDFYLSQ